jgi:hypothetical protein
MMILMMAIGHLFFRFTIAKVLNKFGVTKKVCFLFGVIGSAIVRLFIFKYVTKENYIAVTFILGCLNSLVTYKGMTSLVEYLDKHCQGNLTSGLNFNIIIHGLVWYLFISNVDEKVKDVARSVTVEHSIVNLIIVIFCCAWK